LFIVFREKTTKTSIKNHGKTTKPVKSAKKTRKNPQKTCAKITKKPQKPPKPRKKTAKTVDNCERSTVKPPKLRTKSQKTTKILYRFLPKYRVKLFFMPMRYMQQVVPPYFKRTSTD
jgi:hypothetical protein